MLVAFARFCVLHFTFPVCGRDGVRRSDRTGCTGGSNNHRSLRGWPRYIVVRFAFFTKASELVAAAIASACFARASYELSMSETGVDRQEQAHVVRRMNARLLDATRTRYNMFNVQFFCGGWCGGCSFLLLLVVIVMDKIMNTIKKHCNSSSIDGFNFCKMIINPNPILLLLFLSILIYYLLLNYKHIILSYLFLSLITTLLCSSFFLSSLFLSSSSSSSARHHHPQRVDGEVVVKRQRRTNAFCLRRG